MPNTRTSLSVSARRHFIDTFFFDRSSSFGPEDKVIDIGGKKENKRGLFDIGRYVPEVTYVNIDESTHPDIIADASDIPLPDSSFDKAILAEILEHVPDPLSVLKEAHRLLRPGGKAFITVPFMVGLHGDPDDYGRYTETFWREGAVKTGFEDVTIERQGAWFAVAALMIQHLFIAKGRSWRPIQNAIVGSLMWLDTKTASPLLKSWTTGYGIVLSKPNHE